MAKCFFHLPLQRPVSAYISGINIRRPDSDHPNQGDARPISSVDRGQRPDEMRRQEHEESSMRSLYYSQGIAQDNTFQQQTGATCNQASPLEFPAYGVQSQEEFSAYSYDAEFPDGSVYADNRRGILIWSPTKSKHELEAVLDNGTGDNWIAKRVCNHLTFTLKSMKSASL